MYIKNGETTVRWLQRPIQRWLDDPTATEIVFNKPNEVGIERYGKWEWHNVDMPYDVLDQLGTACGELLGKRFDPANPICETWLPDGQRLTLVQSPGVDKGLISLTIRVPSRGEPTTRDPGFAEQFAEVNLATAPQSRRRDKDLLKLYYARDIPRFLELAAERKRTIMATGIPGSGKTSLIKRLMLWIHPEERVITIEDTSEFRLRHLRNHVALFFGSAGITATRCAEVSLRMRPDRVAMQELRGDEIWGFMRLLAAGYEGAFTTCHAQDGRPFEPLVLMAKQTMAGQTLEKDEIEHYFRQFIDIVVYCKCETTPQGKIFTNPSIWFKDAEDA